MQITARSIGIGIFLTVATWGCSATGKMTGNPDGGEFPDGGGPIGWVPNTPDPKITTCAELTPPATGTCTVTAGGAAMLISGNVLTPGEVFKGGQVLVDDTGSITCVGCDCAANAAGATTVVCPEGVISPGLLNAHDHITFVRNAPYDRTEERYEHRHDWRRGGRGHNSIEGGGSSSNDQMAWGELRFVMGGATSVNGSGSNAGLLRNLDKAPDATELGQDATYYDTFPLDDSSGTLRASGCSYGSSARTMASIANTDAYTPHVAEGIDAEARNEFTCLNEGTNDVIGDHTSIIHGVGLLVPDIAQMSLQGTSLIWSPRTNVTLYGDTASAPVFSTLGVRIALGTDWIITGSMNMLRELRCADELNTDRWHSYFTDEQLWLMATRDAAGALAVDDVLGVLSTGHIADIAIFNGKTNQNHRAIIDAAPADVVLVLKGGKVMYGDADVVTALAPSDACDSLDVCGSNKGVCVKREYGKTLAELTSATAGIYGLFYCETPDNEPSCTPERNAMDPLPEPEKFGSNRYSGEITATDADGDGIGDDTDNCIYSFNPIRPVDMGNQADFDSDGLGDPCDPCPMDANTTMCSALDPNDKDGDGVANAVDNCPDAPNAMQENADDDADGDVCDYCPMFANTNGVGCPSTIYNVKDGTSALGSPVTIGESVVTAIAPNGFYIQVPAGASGYDGPDGSGVFVYTGTAPTVAEGDLVTISLAYVNEFGGELQLGSASWTKTGTQAVPTPVTVAAGEIALGGARADKLNGVLVTITSATVESSKDGTYPTFTLVGGAVVGNLMYMVDPLPQAGETFDSITGVLSYRGSKPQILPRSPSDVVFGSAALASLAPATTFVRVGSPGTGIPAALTITLSRAVNKSTLVNVASSGNGLSVSNVTVPANSTTATVSLTGNTASATPYTVTAMLNGASKMANVHVITANETPHVASITPANGVVPIGGTLTMQVNLDIPARPGGETIGLSIFGQGSVPNSVVIPANTLSASFTFTAGIADATPTISAMGPLDTASTSVTVTTGASGSLVINEVDYDQTMNPDSQEFIELYNTSGSTINLASVAVVRINGSNGMEYGGRVMLSGSLAAGGYLVVGSPTVPVALTAARVDALTSTDAIQNGDPDAIALIDTGNNTVIDAVSYGGAAMGGAYTVVEGTAADKNIDDRGAGSICRSPNGSDTDDAATDWKVCTTSTPGAANSL